LIQSRRQARGRPGEEAVGHLRIERVVEAASLGGSDQTFSDDDVSLLRGLKVILESGLPAEALVHLSNEAIRVLRAHLVRRRAEKLRRAWPELPRPLFCSTAGTYADPSAVRQAFRKVCTKAKCLTRDQGGANGQSGSIPRFTPHGLRHTFAALHLQAGTEVYYVSRMLGHADISLTVHTYGAWLQPDRRSGLDVLDRAPADADAQEARA
jgi:integrase